MARYGFGLLAPDIRASFGLTSGALGLLAAASCVAYLGTSLTAGVLSAHLGARAIVAAGGVCAVAGMALAGVARSPTALFVALLVAGASAGLVFPPFSDVVAHHLPADRRPRVLSAISSGTGWGVALAAPVALVGGADWRAAWLLFALVAAVATGWALVVLPGRDELEDSAGLVRLRPRWFVCPRSGPLLVGGLLVGIASSVYWTFAVDHLVTDGGLSSTQSGASRPSLAWPAWAARWAGMPCDASAAGPSLPSHWRSRRPRSCWSAWPRDKWAPRWPRRSCSVWPTTSWWRFR
jgi:predicted MFS family arabinose efflux permease